MTSLQDLRLEIKRERQVAKQKEAERKLKSELKKLKFNRKFGDIVEPLKKGYKELDTAVGKIKKNQEERNKEVRKGMGLFR
jgi:uncharacterized protein YqhQ